MSEINEKLKVALADRYKIERRLGEGGMATVYLAEDLKHKRKVAVKVLRPELAAVLGAERFVQEITTTANLQHPHILPLFDSGEADSFLYYVMPFIDGETLRDKLNRETQLGIEEAVNITTAIADALDYAHRQNVIHRDIKPENILLHEGRPMVADFGIALAVSAAAGGRMTETGLSLGTPHYMSPEQATAEKDLTNRSDIYSLGSVLYEMLTGEPPHTGASAQAIVMKIVTDEARPVTELRKSVPPHVAAATAKSLEKLAADRFESAAKFAEALTNPAFALPTTQAAPSPSAPLSDQWKGRAVAAIGVAAVMTGLLAWTLVRPRSGTDNPPMRFAFTMGSPLDGDLELAISPDGQRIAQPYADSSGTPRLVVREFATTTLRAVPGTEGAARPFFSPDGAWIGFSAGVGLRKVPIDGGAAIEITDSCEGGTWGPADVIVCVSNSNWGLARVSANGGELEQLTVPDTANGEIGHWKPQILPDGNAVIFVSYRRPTTRIEAYDLATGDRTVLVERAIYARYSPTGHLLYVDGGALFAIRFDAKSLRTEGSAIPLLTDVAAIPSDASAGLAVAANGTLVAVQAADWDRQSKVVWVDRNGREQPALSDAGQYSDLRLASNERRFVVTNTREGGRQIWLYDFDRGALTQLTRSGLSALRPVWTPDGRSVVFTNETPSYDVFQIAVDGSTPALPIVENVHDKYPESVSPNGKMLAYHDRWDQGGRIMLVPLDVSNPPAPFADSSMSLMQDPAFSPDGKWLVYVGGAGSGSDVYVRAVDGSGGRLQVSVDGGTDPRWTRGGREIVYRKGNAFLAVSVDLARGEVGTPNVLFRSRYGDYDATANGNRFLILKPIERPEALPILVLFNWIEELKQRVGN